MQGMLGTLSLSDVQGPRNELEKRLASEAGAEWLGALNRFLRKENPWPTTRTTQVVQGQPEPEWGPVTPFTSLRFLATVTLGRRKNGKEYKNNAKKCGYQVSDWSSDLLVHPKTKFTCATQEEQWDLYVASNRDAGFTKRATNKEIFARMYSEELGWNLEKLPAEIGLALREAYTDQPRGEWLLVSMDPLTDSDGFLGLFLVARADDGVFWVYTDGGNPGHGWHPDVLWVVGRRKSA